jgi:hypothetical protein
MMDTTPIRLTEAAERFKLSVRALRKEADRGRLAVSRVGGKDWTTEKAVLEMFERCRVAPKEPASISDRLGSERGDSTPPSGSSSTEDAKLAQDATRALIERLKAGSPNTSPPSTSRKGASVVFLK